MGRKSHLAILENDIKSSARLKNSNTSFSNSTLLGMFGENFESGSTDPASRWISNPIKLDILILAILDFNTP
jgi:hypothetical protein